MNNGTVTTTICEACGAEHPAAVSHRMGGRYLCVEGSTAGVPHRFVMLTDALEVVAEAATVEDATAGAAFLSEEQGRPIYAMEMATLIERRRLLVEMQQHRDRLHDAMTVALATGMPVVMISAQLELLDGLISGLAGIAG